jgi:glycosyltransferase involved in cell wall biosynthesis
VWLLTNLPSPYQVELLSAVATGGQIDLQVRFMRLVDDDPRVATVPHRILAGLGPRSWRDEFRLHPRAIMEAAIGDGDCYVLSGLYTSATFLVCAALLWLRQKPWFVWLEQPRPPDAPWSGRLVRLKPVQWLRRLVRRLLLCAAVRVVGIGSAAVEAFAAEGVPPSKLGMLPYCCDVRRFDSPKMEEVHRIRERFALDDKIVFLFSGQLIERKGVDVLIRAFERVGRTNICSALLILGDGELARTLKASVRSDLKSRVHFVGYVRQPDLPAYFATADVFVFPSRHDGWGVVINEACAARLPIIATRQTGASRDLIVDGVSGFIVDQDDLEMLAAKMQFLADHPSERKRMGLEGRRMVEPFSVEKASSIFCHEVQKTVQHASIGLGHSEAGPGTRM